MVWNWLIVFPKVLVPGKARNGSVRTVDNAESEGRFAQCQLLPSVLAGGHRTQGMQPLPTLFAQASCYFSQVLSHSFSGTLGSWSSAFNIFFSSSPRMKETLWVVKSKTGVSFGCKGTVLFEKLSYIGRRHPISVIVSESQSLTNGSCVACHETSQTFGMLLDVTVLFLSHVFCS